MLTRTLFYKAINLLKWFTTVSIILLASCTNVVYRTQLVCSPDSYPTHTQAQKNQLVKELMEMPDTSATVLYIGEYMTIQKQIDKCNTMSNSLGQTKKDIK